MHKVSVLLCAVDFAGRGICEAACRRFDGDPTFAASAAFVRQRWCCEFGGSVRRDPVRPMTTAVASMTIELLTY